MVVEALIKPEWVKENPLYALLLGFCLSLIGIFLGFIIFTDEASMAGILIIVMAGVPFFLKIMDIDENVDRYANPIEKFFLRNKKIILIYSLFFIGMTIAYLLAYFVMPDWVSKIIFAKQLNVFSGPVGHFIGAAHSIISNNLWILFLSLILSLLYGAGAIFILTWNASVLGIFIGSFGKVAAIHNFLPYIPHTALEFLGYFVAAIAGGLLSIAFEKGDFGDKFYRVLQDSLALFVTSVIIIIVAGFIEVWMLGL